MNNSNTTLHDQEAALYGMLKRDTLKHFAYYIDNLIAIDLYQHNYHKIHGVTTECANIMGPMGLLPPKEVTPNE